MLAALSSCLSLTAVAGLLLGCRSSTEPQPASTTTYVLQRVAGDPLPAVLVTNEVVEIRVFSDTIRLKGDGTGTISGVQESIPLTPGTPAEGPRHITSPIHYQITPTQIEIAFDCPDLANCIPPPHLLATVRSDGLQVRWGPQLQGRDPLDYVRVTP
jgi:hypothetical protein